MANIKEFLSRGQAEWSEVALDELIHNKLLNRQEWKQVEFKMSMADIHETIAAFTHSNSGLIIVGVNNSGEKIGIDKTRVALCRSISDSLKPVPSDYDVFEIKLARSGNRICVVRVVKNDIICRHKQQYWRREGESNKPLSEDESKSIIVSHPDTTDYSTKPIRDATYHDCLDEKRQGDFLNLYKQERHKEILASGYDFLKMTCRVIQEIDDKEVFNAAGALLFSKLPQYFIPHSKARCIKYAGNDVTSGILDSLDCEGNLIEIIELAFSFVKRNVANIGNIDGTRTKYFLEYPEITFREAIINAISHRDYTLENLDTQVFIFNNRIEIISPGNFPPDSLENNIPIKHCPRNRLIAQLLQDCGYGDRTGSGVKKIIRAMEELKRKKPEFKDGDRRAKVTLWGRSSVLEDLKGRFKLNQNQIKAIDVAVMQGYIKTGQDAALLGCSRVEARGELKKLVKLGIMAYKGKGRAANYILQPRIAD